MIGTYNNQLGFVALVTEYFANIINLLNHVYVPFFHITFYELYINLSFTLVAIMIFKAFFSVGIDGSGDFAIVRKVVVTDKNRWNGFPHHHSGYGSDDKQYPNNPLVRK